MAEKSYFQHVETYDEEDLATAPQNPPNMGTLSKQFQPKKLKDGNKLWKKGAEAEAEQESYVYTPFRAATLGKSSSLTPKPTRDTVHSGTLRPPKSANPFVYDPPSAPTTPRIPRVARPESAAGTMSREQKLTWGRAAQNQAGPQHFRSNSAMSRARPNEFSAMAMNQPPILAHPSTPQRYPSFQTLPRGEPIDSMMMCPSPFYGPPPPPTVLLSSSRPPSAVPSLGHPGASNLQGYGVPIVVPAVPVTSPTTVLLNQKAINTQLAQQTQHLNWNRISIVCCLQVLFCLSIFGIGVARIMFGALWAIGIEIIFATCSLFPALIGIFAVRRGSYSAALFCFAANAFEMVFAVFPFVIGIFPIFPIIFPRVEKSWFLAENEPIHFDLILSFLVAVQVFLALFLSIMGCRAGGSVMTNLDELKLAANMRKAFEEDRDELPFKH
ncbi:unnamed protein product [Caenorhabditis angaria]|uniref:Uncharacterized protein n=1 Tax=Caenorhabditis angaria TaxID=860376 RepID=A0A9P1N583_9PELO|nr:unnamed protein product [Caenorhabditis angaria]